jgi:hypothetical protein
MWQHVTAGVHVYGAGSEQAFVATGDIPDEWIRDSSVQLGVYLPRIAAHPSFRQVGGGGTGGRQRGVAALGRGWTSARLHAAASCCEWMGEECSPSAVRCAVRSVRLVR